MDSNDHTVTAAGYEDLRVRVASIETETSSKRGRALLRTFLAYLIFSVVAVIAMWATAATYKLDFAFQSKDSIGVLLGAVALTFVVGWFGFVAFKRLELYDAEMGRIRDEIGRIRKLVDNRSDKLREEQRTTFREMTADIAPTVKSEVQGVLDKAIAEQQKTVDLLSSTADETVAKLARYEFLRMRAAAETSVHLEQRLLSLKAVHDQIESLFGKVRQLDFAIFQRISPNEELLALRDKLHAEAIDLVRQALEKDIQGHGSDYHNFAAELGKNNYYGLAVKALEHGIKRFPTNTDLVADAVQMALGAGDMEATELYYIQLRKIDWTKWTWRGFTFSIKYMVAKGDEVEAHELHQKALQFMPFDERPSVQYAELFLERGQIEKAKDILEDRFKRLKSAPQVAFRLAELYKDLGQYPEAIATGQAALRMDAQDQSVVNNAAVLLNIGLSGEALWCTEFETQRQTPSDDVREGLRQSRNFLVHYAAAIGSPDCTVTVRQAIKLRLATVRANLLFLGLSKEDCDRYFLDMGLDLDPPSPKNNLPPSGSA